MDILVLGGAHIDRRGRISGETVPGASNPGTWIEEPGGGAFNAARALSRLGLDIAMITPRGGDGLGERVGEAARDAGIDDRPFTFLDRATPSYTAILERDGNLVIGFADMELYRLFTPRRLQIKAVRAAFEDAKSVLVDANLPAETLAAIAARARQLNRPLAAIAISPAKVGHYASCLEGLDYLFLNRAEAAVVAAAEADHPSKWPDLLRKAGLKGGVVTHGAGPVVAFAGMEAWILQPPPLAAIADVTGAGDSLAAGVLFGLSRRQDLGQALRHGVALAGLTLLSPHATVENLDADMLATALRQVPQPSRL